MDIRQWYLRQAEATYLSSRENFLDYRLRYYANMSTSSVYTIKKRILSSDLISHQSQLQRQKAIEKLAYSRAKIIIVTASKNRINYLALAYQWLDRQVSCQDWLWLVIDNGSQDGTQEYLASLNDSRVLCIEYKELTGCAFPVRNFGLDLIYLAYHRNIYGNKWLLYLDSDDRLYNEYSLHEVTKLQYVWSGRRLGYSLLHGYAYCIYEEPNGQVTYGTIPREITSDFPHVNTLVEFLDKGPNILSGIIPVDSLDWLRFPPEVSFEDDGFNQKLLLQSKRKKQRWLATNYPVIIKTFTDNTMTGLNSNSGTLANTAILGGRVVTGIRAQIVKCLEYMMDYYSREAL